MTSVNDMPADIWEAAENALDNMLCHCRESSGSNEAFRRDSVNEIARAILAERQRCEEVARSWGQTCKSVGQTEGEGVARDIRLCIGAGIPAAPKGGA